MRFSASISDARFHWIYLCQRPIIAARSMKEIHDEYASTSGAVWPVAPGAACAPSAPAPILPLGIGGGRLEVLHGRVWLTRAGDLDDHVVDTGAGARRPAVRDAALVEAWDDERAGARRLAADAARSTASARAVGAIFGRCWDIVDPVAAHRRRRGRRGRRARRRRVRCSARSRRRARARSRRRAVLHNSAGARTRIGLDAGDPNRILEPMSAPTPASELETLRTKLVAARQALPDRLERSVQLQQILRVWLVGRRETIDRRLLADQGRVRSAAGALPLERGRRRRRAAPDRPAGRRPRDAARCAFTSGTRAARPSSTPTTFPSPRAPTSSCRSCWSCPASASARAACASATAAASSTARCAR